MKPIHKLGGTLCNRCRVVLSKKHTNHLLCNKCVEEYVREYPVKSKWGFNPEELADIIQEFPDINIKKFDLAMGVHTVITDEGKIITFPYDVITALRCGIENRDIKLSEWD